MLKYMENASRCLMPLKPNNSDQTKSKSTGKVIFFKETIIIVQQQLTTENVSNNKLLSLRIVLAGL